MSAYRIEYCTGDTASAIKAAQYVDQIEFCDDLEHDGLTPRIADIVFLKERIEVPIKAMIRNHYHGFVYSEKDLEVMYREADDLINSGVDKLVFGALDSNGRLSIDQIERMAAHIFPTALCVHKSIDLSPEILEDLQLLVSIDNVTEVLTSGGKPTAREGKDMLKKMIALVGSKIDIIAAGKITYEYLEEIHSLIKAPIYHGQKIVKIP